MLRTFTITKATAAATAAALRSYQDRLEPTEAAVHAHATADLLAENLEWMVERFAWTTAGSQHGINLTEGEINVAAQALKLALRDARADGAGPEHTATFDAAGDLATLGF